MNQIPNRISELDPKNNYVIMCRTGVRSSQICEFLEDCTWVVFKNKPSNNDKVIM